MQLVVPIELERIKESPGSHLSHKHSLPVCVFLAPGGFPSVDYPLRLVTARQLAAFSLQIAFLNVLARLKHVVIEPGHGILNEVIGSASARGGEVQQLLFRAGGEIHFHAFGSFFHGRDVSRSASTIRHGLSGPTAK
jgi:hypothetical protein